MSDTQPDNTRRFPAVATTDLNATAAPYIVRPLFFVGCVLLVISALGQLGGRILFANLDRLEPRINSLLADRGFAVAGLEGDWRFFNPILRVGSGEAPGVQFGASWAEIDTLESLSRNRVVLRNASVTDLHLSLSQDEAGAWSLDGRLAAQTTFDWQSLIWHSDQLELQAFVGLQGFELPVSELHVKANVTNFGGRHRGDVRLSDGGACTAPELAAPAGCALRGRYNVEETALWFRPRTGGAIVDTANLEFSDSAAALLGLESLRIGSLDGRLRLLDDRFSGPLNLLETQVQLRGGKPVTLSVLADGWSQDDGSEAGLHLEAVRLSHAGAAGVEGEEGVEAKGSVEDKDSVEDKGSNVLELRDARVNWVRETGAVLNVPSIQVDDVTSVVGEMLAPDSVASRWVTRLGMTGTFTRLLASWSPEAGVGYGGDFDNVAIQNFRGVPSANNAGGSFTGGQNYLQLRFLDTPAIIGFPQLYPEPRSYDSVTGQVLMYFGPNYFGLAGNNLSIVEGDVTTVGSFSLVSAKPLSNNHLTLALSSNASEFADLTDYVPSTLPQNALDWLANSELKAGLTVPSFVMHSPLREEESLMQRSYVIEADMRNGAMIFNAEWPRITQADGRVRVSHTGVTANLERAKFAGLDLRDMTFRLPPGTTSVSAQGEAVFDAGAGLEFIRTTPLRTSMDFVADDWWADGQMRLNLDLDLPLDDLSQGELDPRIRVTVTGELLDTAFGLPEAGLTFHELRGPLTYSYPYKIAGNNISGVLFGQPMRLDISTSAVASALDEHPEHFAPSRIDFSMAGAMHSDEMWPLLNMDPSNVVDGLFDFNAVYSTETDTDARQSLVARTGFSGAAVNLPDPFGKTPDEVAATEVRVEFGDELTRANLLYRGLLNADLGIAEEGISGGHVRLFKSARYIVDGDGEPAGTPSDTNQQPLASWDGVAGPLRIDGTLERADVRQWSSGDTDQGGSLPPYQIADLQISEAVLGDFVIPDVLLSGYSDVEHLQLQFNSASATGELFVPEEGMTELHLTEFIYVDTAADVGQVDVPRQEDVSASVSAALVAPIVPVVDPLTPELMASLQDMRVSIDSLLVDGEDYGSWRFDVLREPTGVGFKDLKAELKGIQVSSQEGVAWTSADNRTSFKGSLTAGDMGDVIEAWGYARSIQSTSMLTNADVSWSGSPLNFEPLRLRGEIATGINDGRFLEDTSANNALRLFSLINFKAFTKRFGSNFKDVFDRGVSFEKAEAALRLDDGLITLTQPMRVEGRGADFKVNGSVNLVSGQLNNEMVVTLPVNKSLPWLGAYLALVNPVVGIGVIIGERLLRKPLKGLSSAKYTIRGNIADPQLELVSVFDRSMDEGEIPETVEMPEVLDIPELEIQPEGVSAVEVDGSLAPPTADSVQERSLDVLSSEVSSEVSLEVSSEVLSSEILSSDDLDDLIQFDQSVTDFEQKEIAPDGSIATSPGS